MITRIQLILIILLAFTSYNLFAQANLKIVHNSSDPALEQLDVYINGNVNSQTDNLDYRTATDYFEVSSNEDINLTLTIASSTNDEANFKSINLGTLTKDEFYIVFINGIALDAQDYSSDIQGRDISIELYSVGGGDVSSDTEFAEVNIHHGVTDAPAVDIYLRNNDKFNNYPVIPQISALDFSNNSGYTLLEPANGKLD